ncbi:hypothetical protein MAR_021622, partial [Mya arenaria]
MTQIFTCSTEQSAKFVELLKYNDKYAAIIGYPKDVCIIQIRAYVSNCSCASPTSYKCTSYPLTRLNFTDPWICVDAPEGSILIANKTYFMIRGSETIQQLQCSVIGGNPLANLFWKCYNGNQTYRNITDKAVSSVTWRAGHTKESVCTCFASHKMEWSDEKNVTVKVLYPPLKPLCEVGNFEIAPGTLNVSLSSNLTLSCYSEANPEPNYFRWSFPNGTTKPGSILSICDIQAEDE